MVIYVHRFLSCFAKLQWEERKFEISLANQIKPSLYLSKMLISPAPLVDVVLHIFAGIVTGLACRAYVAMEVGRGLARLLAVDWVTHVCIPKALQGQGNLIFVGCG